MAIRLLLLIFFLLASPTMGRQALAQVVDAPNVLILQSLDSQTDPYLTVTQVFRARFQSHYDAPVSFAEISLDARWGGRKDREPFQVQLIRNRVIIQRPDLVVCVGPSAIDFWRRYRDDIAAQLPTIMAARESYRDEAALEPGDAGIFSEWSIPRSVDQILALLPDTREVVVVFGASELERAQTEEARRQLAGYSDQLQFTYTSDLSMAEIESLVAHLPEHSAVLLGILSVDSRGLLLPLKTGAERLIAASRAPVFSAFDTELGMGVVGGRLIRLRRLAQEIADAGVQLLDEPHAEALTIVVPQSVPTYDWRALRRWNIDAGRLTADSRIVFREPSVWDRYRNWILLIAGALALQSLLIASLLVQHRRLRQSELAGTRLTSRLITAHEDERRRIAGELHDDLSQRLAGLAIDAAMASTDPGSERNSALLKQLHPELVRISKDVHDLSYRLHPSIVEELGLGPAMRAEIDRMRRLSGCTIHDRIEPLQDAPSREVALCLYRITQEALQNALRHANAGVIYVILRQHKGYYALKVQDDGLGFELPDPAREIGIGLSGMRERARHVGGSLTVRTKPGKGTSVRAKIPLVNQTP